jgi:hypothetical protein
MERAVRGRPGRLGLECEGDRDRDPEPGGRWIPVRSAVSSTATTATGAQIAPMV